MNKPLLDGPMSVARTIEKFASNHMGRNPTFSEFRDVCVMSGNTNAEINRHIKCAITAGIVCHDKDTDVLSIGDWRNC
jgi:hypothetical protein